MKKILAFAITTIAATAAMAACKEGARGYITKYDASGDRTYNEARICKNGTYMNDEEKAAYVYKPRTGCVEGARGTVTKYDASGDRSYTEFRTCKNGSYMNAEERAAYVRVPKNKCKEGSFGRARATDYYPEKAGSYGDHVPEIGTVCKAGKWVPRG